MRLHFRKLGSGPPLVILHGLYGSGDNWYSIARKLSSYMTIYLVDQRNHGLSPHDKIHDYEAMTADVSEFISDQKLEMVSLLGHSMGGKTAMNFALKYPSMIDKLIVIDIALRSYINSPILLLNQKLTQLLQSIELNKFNTRSELDSNVADKIPDVAIRQFLLKNVARDTNGIFYWRFNLEILSNSIFEILDKTESSEKSFKGPSLIISGTKSGFINSYDQADFRETFPSMRFEKLESGHWVHYEQPDKLCDLLIEFLTEMSEK